MHSIILIYDAQSKFIILFFYEIKEPAIFIFTRDINLNIKFVIFQMTLRLAFYEHFMTWFFMEDIYQTDLIIRKHQSLQKYHLSLVSLINQAQNHVWIDWSVGVLCRPPTSLPATFSKLFKNFCYQLHTGLYILLLASF